MSKLLLWPVSDYPCPKSPLSLTSSPFRPHSLCPDHPVLPMVPSKCQGCTCFTRALCTCCSLSLNIRLQTAAWIIPHPSASAQTCPAQSSRSQLACWSAFLSSWHWSPVDLWKLLVSLWFICGPEQCQIHSRCSMTIIRMKEWRVSEWMEIPGRRACWEIRLMDFPSRRGFTSLSYFHQSLAFSF